MESAKIEIVKSTLLKTNQYYSDITKKRKICLHHTAGGSASSSISWWNEKPDHIAAPFLIERDGTIIQAFDPSYWAYALGLNGGTELEKESIQIEICNWGWVQCIGGEFFTATPNPRKLNKESIITYKEEHRGAKYYEKYTDAQVHSVVELVSFLAIKFKIEINDIQEFWHYGKKSNLFSHTTVRKDKSDIHPQPNLIKGLYDRFGCKAAITE